MRFVLFPSALHCCRGCCCDCGCERDFPGAAAAAVSTEKDFVTDAIQSVDGRIATEY